MVLRDILWGRRSKTYISMWTLYSRLEWGFSTCPRACIHEINFYFRVVRENSFLESARFPSPSQLICPGCQIPISLWDGVLCRVLSGQLQPRGTPKQSCEPSQSWGLLLTSTFTFQVVLEHRTGDFWKPETRLRLPAFSWKILVCAEAVVFFIVNRQHAKVYKGARQKVSACDEICERRSENIGPKTQADVRLLGAEASPPML